jgi:hypothetical protein
MIFVKLDDIGDIRLIKDIPKGQPLPEGEGWIEISELENALALLNAPRSFVLDLEDDKPVRLREKKEVKIIIKTRIIEPDGRDTARVEFELPEGIDKIEVELQGVVGIPKTIVEISRGEPLEFTSEDTDLIRISLVRNKELVTFGHKSYVLARRKDVDRGPFALEKLLPRRGPPPEPGPP